MGYSIYDIAKMTGFSASTVSKAINGSSEISEATREKILSVAKEIGYIPSASARAIANKKNNLVGLLFTDDLNIGIEHPLFSAIIHVFKEKMAQNGYDTIFISSQIGDTKYSYLEHVKYRHIDGVFIVSYLNVDENLLNLTNSNIPCVATDMEESLNIPTVLTDNKKGVQLSVDYLLSLGHTQIGNICGPYETNFIAKLRYDSYRETLTNRNIQINEDYIVKSEYYDFESGYQAAKEMILRLGSSLPSAIIVASDIIALGAIKCFKEHGLKIPQDLSIIGYDDLKISSMSDPALTTIKQDTDAIGLSVADLLINQIEGQEVSKRVTVDVELIERETCMKYVEKKR